MARACSENILIRVTPEEKKLLAEKAALLGLSVGAFLVFKSLGEELGQAILDTRCRRKKQE